MQYLNRKASASDGASRHEVSLREKPNLQPSAARGDFALKVQGVTHVFDKKTGTKVLDDVSLCVKSGELLVLAGMSGSGKSTLLRILNGLILPTCGQVFVEGQEIGLLSRHELRHLRRSVISMVFQSFALLPHLNVWENVGVGVALCSTKASDLL